MKIYTRGGDAGETGLLGGVRVAKDSLRTETCGQVDELNCLLGLARCEDLPAALYALLARVQHELFAVGAEVAAPEPLARGTHRIGPAEIAAVEAEIDGAEAMLSPCCALFCRAANLCRGHAASGGRSAAWPDTPTGDAGAEERYAPLAGFDRLSEPLGRPVVCVSAGRQPGGRPPRRLVGKIIICAASRFHGLPDGGWH